MPDIDALLKRIRLAEDTTLERKQVLLAGDKVIAPTCHAFADELASFANTRGGTILLGVDDKSHAITGIPIEKLDAVEGWVQEICNDTVKPPLDALIRKISLPDPGGDDVPIIRVDLSRSLFVHKSPGGYFRRVGSAKREMGTDVLARLLQERSQSRMIRFDESPVIKASPDCLEAGLVHRFLRHDAVADLAMLRKLRVVADDDDGNPWATVGGILLCTREPEQWLPHARIQAVCYAGTRRDINYQLDARDCGGPLDQQVIEALHFARRNMRVAASKGLARVDRPQFSERALFEALVNAVAHRDYAMAGAQIRFHLFQDRVEFHVPGALANTLTPDSMELRQYSRNELIVSLLTRCEAPDQSGGARSHMMERRGDGVPIILNESRELSGRKPEYTVIDESELRLVIRAAQAAPE